MADIDLTQTPADQGAKDKDTQKSKEQTVEDNFMIDHVFSMSIKCSAFKDFFIPFSTPGVIAIDIRRNLRKEGMRNVTKRNMDTLAKFIDNFHLFANPPLEGDEEYSAMKTRIYAGMLTIVLSLVIFSALQAAASPLLIGREAPPFQVESGDGKVLEAKMLRGKVVVLFYESKDIIAKSRPLKIILNAFYKEQKKEDQQMILRVPIFDCTGVSWPFKGIWKNGLIENSKRVGMTVYGDWNGKMAASYGMKSDDTNLLIIDKRGIIRYFQSGVVTDNGETATILKKLLKDLVAENHEDKIIPKQS